MKTIHRMSVPSSSSLSGRGRRLGAGSLAAAIVAVLMLFGAGGAGAAAVETTARPMNTAGYSAHALAAQGAAELAAGHTGRALLAYQRAGLLAPRSPTVQAGLKQAHAAAGLPDNEPSGVARVLRFLNANEWSRIAAVCAGVVAAAFVALAWGVRSGWLLATMLGSVTAFGMSLAAAAWLTPPSDAAVVVAPDALARIAPFPTAETEFVEPEGAVVTVQRTHGGFALVRGPRGSGCDRGRRAGAGAPG